MIHRRFALRTAAFSIAILALGTSAWADITGTVWRIQGNNMPASSVAPSSASEGTFTAPGVNFDLDVPQDDIAPGSYLSDFLATGGATNLTFATGAGAPINQPMSGEVTQGVGANEDGYGNSCFNNVPNPSTGVLVPTNSAACYSTVIEIQGTATFASGVDYTINHDDGIVLELGGTQVADCPGSDHAPTANCLYSADGKPAANPTSNDASTFVGDGTVNESFTIWYMATNGNPDVLTLTPNVATPEPGSISMLLTMLLGVGFFGMKKRFA